MYRSFILGIPKIITSNVTVYYIPLFHSDNVISFLILLGEKRVMYRDIFIEIDTFLMCYI